MEPELEQAPQENDDDDDDEEGEGTVAYRLRLMRLERATTMTDGTLTPDPCIGQAPQRASNVVQILRSGGYTASVGYHRRSTTSMKTHVTRAPSGHDCCNVNTMLWSYRLSTEQLADQLHPVEACVRSASKRRGAFLRFFLRLASNRCFTLWCFLVIGANTIFMGFQADATARHARGEIESLELYHTTEKGFIIWFIVESIIRTLGSPVSIWKDHMLLFDFLVIALSAIEQWALEPASMLDGAGHIISIFVVFRVLRLSRAVKLVRSVKFFRSLVTMLDAVWHSRASFLSAMLLLVAFICPSALILMALVGPVTLLDAQGDVELEGALACFQDLTHTTLTLFQTVLRGEEWGPIIVRPLLNHPRTKSAGVAFVMITSMGQIFIMSIIAGLFIEEMLKTVRMHNVVIEKEHIYHEQAGTEPLRDTFVQIGNGESALTWRQFSNGLAMHPDLVMQLGVNLEVAHTLFRQLASDNTKQVDIDEFIFGLIKMTWQSKSIDMLIMDYQHQRAQKDVGQLNARFERDVKKLHEITESMAKKLSSIISYCQPMRSTLKARLRAQIKRLSESCLLTRLSPQQIAESSTAIDSPTPCSPTVGSAAGGCTVTAESEIKEQPLEVLPPPLPLLENWFQFLEREGRPCIRREIAAVLSTSAVVSQCLAGSSATSPGNPKAGTSSTSSAADSRWRLKANLLGPAVRRPASLGAVVPSAGVGGAAAPGSAAAVPLGQTQQLGEDLPASCITRFPKSIPRP